DGLLRLGEAAAVRLGDGDEGGVLLLLEIEDVPLADQAEADEADADALVGAGHALIGGRGQRDGAGGASHEGAARNRGGGERVGCHAELREARVGAFVKGNAPRARRPEPIEAWRWLRVAPREPPTGPAAANSSTSSGIRGPCHCSAFS